MDHTYWAYLDYLEIRRRVERLLRGPMPVLVHLVVFLLATAFVLGAVGPARYGFFPPDYGFIMTVWSVALLVHGWLNRRRSGASEEARERAIETEMRERLRTGDTALLDNPRQAFLIHALMEQDIRWRSGFTAGLFAFLIFNTLNWIMWMAFAGGATSWAWQVTIPLAVLWLAPAFLWDQWRRPFRDRKLREQMANWENYADPAVVSEKRKRLAYEEVEPQRFYGYDGEAMEVIDDDYPQAGKAKPSG